MQGAPLGLVVIKTKESRAISRDIIIYYQLSLATDHLVSDPHIRFLRQERGR